MSLTQVVVLSPLATCTTLEALDCDMEVPMEQLQYVQAACGSLVVTQYDDGLSDSNLVVHPDCTPQPNKSGDSITLTSQAIQLPNKSSNSIT